LNGSNVDPDRIHRNAEDDNLRSGIGQLAPAAADVRNDR